MDTVTKMDFKRSLTADPDFKVFLISKPSSLDTLNFYFQFLIFWR